MKKKYLKVVLLFVCFALYFAFLTTLTITMTENESKTSNVRTNINNIKKDVEREIVNKDNNEIKYRYIQNINELISFTSNMSSGSGTPLIIIGLNGNYMVDGIDTGINAISQDDSFGVNGAYVLFVENTSETSDELIYSIFYSNKKVKEFSIDKETKKIKNEYNLDIKIGENGNWFINDIDTNISATRSSYEDFISEYNSSISKEEWLKELVDGSLDIKDYVSVAFYPENGDYPYIIKYVKGTKFVEFASPNIEGFTFVGWINEDNKLMECGKSVINSDTILHAIYRQNDYLLKIDYNNGEASDFKLVHYNQELSLPHPLKKGFTFLGWYNDGKLMDSVYSIKKDTCIVAKWCPNYTLNRANSDSSLCNSELTIKDLSMSDGWYCDDILVLYPGNHVTSRIMTSNGYLDRASGTSSVINDETKLDIVGETKSKVTAMIQELDYESEPRYYVRT